MRGCCFSAAHARFPVGDLKIKKEKPQKEFEDSVILLVKCELKAKGLIRTAD